MTDAEAGAGPDGQPVAEASPDRRAIKHIAKQVRRAHVEPDGGSGDGNPLTESVVVLHGEPGSVAEPPPGFRARYEVLDVQGRELFALLIASRFGDDADLVVAPDGAELVRLEKAWTAREGAAAAPDGLSVVRPRNQVAYRMKRLGLEPRLVVTQITRTRGGAGPSGTGRDFVIEHHPPGDARLRMTAGGR